MTRATCIFAPVLGAVTLSPSIASGQAHPPAAGIAADPSTSSLNPVVSGEPSISSDGAYGRFDGDLDVGMMLGTELAPETRRGSARLSLHYFSMAGLAVGYADALGSESRYQRTLTLGVDLRPLFIPRWSNDLTRGPALLDLTLDSLSLGAGAFWDQETDRGFGSRRGFEGSVGVGLPLFARARGLWLEGRAIARWPSGGPEASPRAEGAAQILIGWHQLFETCIVR